MIEERSLGRQIEKPFQEYGAAWRRLVWNDWVMELLSQLALTEWGLLPRKDFNFDLK